MAPFVSSTDRFYMVTLDWAAFGVSFELKNGASYYSKSYAELTALDW